MGVSTQDPCTGIRNVVCVAFSTERKSMADSDFRSGDTLAYASTRREDSLFRAKRINHCSDFVARVALEVVDSSWWKQQLRVKSAGRRTTALSSNEGHRGSRYSPSRSFCANWFLALLCIRSIYAVAGGGFVPQPLIDSAQLTDSMIVRNAQKGHKGKFVIQFSFGSLVLSISEGTPSRTNKRGRQSQGLPHLRRRLRTNTYAASPRRAFDCIVANLPSKPRVCQF